MDEKEIRKRWNERGYKCDVWIDPPGQIWHDFVHDVDELFTVLDGRVELVMAGLTLLPEIGEEIAIPANTIHTVRNVGDGESRWLYGYREK
ncbi:MAG: uncharacterized protein JWQ98_2651 [Chlorobi bacterium]|jgi:mannose-6-phosphate isomerase-like protein (cupin superfamily)|nr:uncharacterized protein [Chlorobiota bacterium]